MSLSANILSCGRCIARHAERRPNEAAIVPVDVEGGEEIVTRRALEARTNQVARLLAQNGPGERRTLVVCLPNSLDHYYATIAGWKLGALVVPLRYDIPEREALKILAVAEPTLVVSERPFPNYPCFERRRFSEGAGLPDGALPDVTLIDVQLTPAKSHRVRLP